MVTVHIDVCLARRVASLRRLWIFILVLCVTREWTSHRGLKGNYVGAAGGEWLGEWDGCRGGRSRSRRWRIGGDTSDNLARSVVRRSSFLVSAVLCRATKRISPDARASSASSISRGNGQPPWKISPWKISNYSLLSSPFAPLPFKRDIFSFISLLCVYDSPTFSRNGSRRRKIIRSFLKGSIVDRFNLSFETLLETGWVDQECVEKNSLETLVSIAGARIFTSSSATRR